MPKAKLARLREVLERAVVEHPGAADRETRARAFAGEPLSGAPLSAWVEKVRRHAYRVTDEDAAALREAGYSEEAIFDLTAAAAVGAANAQLTAGLSALAGAENEGSDAS